MSSASIASGVGRPPEARARRRPAVRPEVDLRPEDVTGGREHTGVEIVRAERVLRPVVTGNGTRTAIVALVHARQPT